MESDIGVSKNNLGSSEMVRCRNNQMKFISVTARDCKPDMLLMDNK